jgi:WD40-like Beta Propeller Repeat
MLRSSTATLVLTILIGCQSKNETTINYLNERDPGNKAELFAPGVISTEEMEHSSPAFAPDGSLVLWCVVNSTYRGYLMEMEFKNGTWSTPRRPSFADSTADDYYPSFSHDGSKLYFGSRRAMPEGYPPSPDMRIWEVSRTENGWGTPIPIDTTVSRGHEYGFSVSKNGSVYFVSSDNWDIAAATKSETGFTPTSVLPFSVNGVDYEDGPFIAPDESYLIFESQRADGINNSIDLYISFRKLDGRWGVPMNMGKKINTEFSERLAKVSPDGKYLFFGSSRLESENRRGYDIYWISTSIINELRDSINHASIDEAIGIPLLSALHADNNEESQKLLHRWINSYPPSAIASIHYISSLRKSKDYEKAKAYLQSVDHHPGAGSPYLLEDALINYSLNEDEAAEKLLATLSGNPYALRNRYLYISNGLVEAGKFDASEKYFDKAMVIHNHGREWLTRARALARADRIDDAFIALNKAMELGGFEAKDIVTAVEFESMKADKRWGKRLVK